MELVLRNKEIIRKLDNVANTLKSNNIENFVSCERFSPDDAKVNGESYLTKEYLFKHMDDPNHEGFPVEHYSIPVAGVTESGSKEIFKLSQWSRNDFITEMGANDNAVFLYYPPGGFVGWHTNENNSGYQFIFSWSEKADGYFQYYDKETGKIIKLPDKPGWQARCYHFGQYEIDHCWHSAYTNVPRITICVLFRWWDKPEMKDQILAMKDQLIEEIESED